MAERFVVVGAGPAGMTAALTLADEAVVPVVIDAQAASGGQIWRGKPKTDLHRAFERAASDGRIDLRTGAVVVDALPGALATTAGRVPWDRLVVAAGARELFLPFPGWTLPGVMGAGGLQAAVKSGFDVRGKRIVLGGSGPLLLAVAALMQEAGAEVLAICESTSRRRMAGFGLQTALVYGKVGEALRLGPRLAGLVRTGTWITRIEPGLKAVLNTGQTLEADLIGVGWGLVPNLELPRLLGCRIAEGRVAVDRGLRSSQASIWCAGETTGIGGVDAAVAEGRLAARSALELDASALTAQVEKWRAYTALMEKSFTLPPAVLQLAEPETVVCRCEEVAYGELANDPAEARLDQRIGMGWCQGRVCGAACTAMFGWPEPSVRPPAFPIRAAQYANLLSDHDAS